MKRRDQRRAEELANIAAQLELEEKKVVEYHSYQFINKIEEKWRRTNPTSDRNWAPNKLLYKCLPNYRLKLVDSNEDLLELSDFTSSDLKQNSFETSLSALTAEDGGEVVVDRNLVVEELSVEKITIDKVTEKKEIVILAENALTIEENTADVETSPKEVHILNLPCDCALCRKIAMRKLAREQGSVPTSAQTTEKVQQVFAGKVPATSTLKTVLPSEMDVEKSSKRKSSLRPSTAADRSSSKLVEQLRGNISKQRAVTFNTHTQLTDSVSSSSPNSYEMPLVKSSKGERDSKPKRKA